MAQIVPVTSGPNQTVQVTLTINGVVTPLTLQLSYSEICSYWVMTFSDQLGNVLADSIPLLAGAWPAANILEQQVYLSIGLWAAINVSGIDQDHPGSDNLGTDWLLLADDTPAN